MYKKIRQLFYKSRPLRLFLEYSYILEALLLFKNKYCNDAKYIEIYNNYLNKLQKRTNSLFNLLKI